jgi:hypothetical protein
VPADLSSENGSCRGGSSKYRRESCSVIQAHLSDYHEQRQLHAPAAAKQQAVSTVLFCQHAVRKPSKGRRALQGESTEQAQGGMQGLPLLDASTELQKAPSMEFINQ